MPWQAITFELDAERAEAMSEALAEAGAESVCLEDALGGAAPWPRTRLTALAAARTDARALVAAAAQACGLPEPGFSVGHLDDADWVRASQAQFAPLRVGERLWIVRSWHPQPAGEALAITLDPGLAFGTGEHPSTRLVLRWLEQTIGGGERLLDYGCGSGILAIAAARLGAAIVAGVDIDPQALEAAAANARANRVALELALPEGLAAGTHDVVVANILSGPLVALAPLLAARTRPGGRLALSGILEEQADEVLDAYRDRFDAARGATEEGWTLIEGRRR